MRQQPTADLCDAHSDVIQIAHPGLGSYGGKPGCAGPIRTVRCFEDNSRVRDVLRSPGEGAVLVVDGAGSMGCALLGDKLGGWAVDNGWAGIIVHGCVRDTEAQKKLPIGLFALAAHPMASRKQGRGELDVSVAFLGVRFEPGDTLVADADGLIVLPGGLLE